MSIGLLLIGWWYISGWTWLLKESGKKFKTLQETFSVGILLKTLFSPWKQITTPSSFRNFFQAAIDNLVSRVVGATVRILMLIAAFFLTLFLLAGTIIALLAWPILPLLPIILPAMSIIGVEPW